MVTITPYGTDSTCTSPEVWGPWTATTDAIGHYVSDPIPTGAPAGVYYYKASSMGVLGAAGSTYHRLDPVGRTTLN